MEKKRVTVTISGRDYSIVSGVEQKYIEKVASYLNDKMREIAENYPNIPETKVAVLAALNITDELFQSRKDGPFDGKSEAIIGELTRKLSEIL